MSILAETGRYITGETSQQWRGDGHCEMLPLKDVIDVVPDYTVAHMVASKRLEEEGAVVSSDSVSLHTYYR